MIIVSQDKELILNLENIEAIGIGNPLEDDDGMFKVLASTTSDNEYTLGKYKTEERAKKVLQEIISRYEHAQRNLADSNDTSPFNEVFVYKMPLEWEGANEI